MAQQYTYADLEIRIFDRRDEGYPVDITLANTKQFPRGYLRADFLPWVSGAVPAEDGERLFDWLFADERLKTAWAEVRGAHPQRRVRLRIDASAPGLHAIPWELLRDPGDEGVTPQDLAATTSTPFSRYLAGRWEPGGLILKRPIKVLVAVANPQNLAKYSLPPVDVEAEWASLKDVTAGLDVDPIQLPQPCTLSGLEAELKKGYHILHFVGHGAYSERQGKAALYMADQENQVKLEYDADIAAMLARLLAETEAGREDRLRLVFLASCRTATRSPADAFRGLAPQLVAAEVPAVIAMQDLVPVATAREFSRMFYHGLLEHGLVDLASNQARSALLTGDFTGSSIPVLFSRLPDNQLLAPVAVPETLPFEPETIYIPAGPFLMGSPPGAGIPEYETPQHTVDIPAYRIGKYPVTNEQYAEFIRQSKKLRLPIGWERDSQTPPADKLNHPVTGVTWYDAMDYCEWLSQQTGRIYTLPSQAQWQKAARGTDGRIYPWGNEWDPICCNHESKHTTPVDAHPDGASPYDCYDMVGNVREWTRTLWGQDPRKPDPGLYRPHDGPKDPVLEADTYIWRVHCGGAAGDKQERLRCSAIRAYYPDRPGTPGRRFGFRVVLEIQN